MKISGIYSIICLENGKYYVGSSNDCLRRKGEHFKMLRHNYHPNIYLQRSFNLYGEKKMIFVILEECNINNLLNLEQEYLNGAKTKKIQCINLSFIAGKIEMTREVKNKISKANFGRKHSQQTKIKMSQNHTHCNLGKHLSKDTKEKISQILKGRENKWCFKKIYQINKKTKEIIRHWDSIIEASRNFNHNNSSVIIRALKGKRKSAFGFIWKYV